MRRLATLLAALGLTLAAGAPAALAQETTPPETTATLNPADPGPGGTYDGPVEVTLSAADPDEDAPPPETHEVVASSFSWSPNALEVAGGDTVNWDFSNGAHDVCLGSEVPDEWTGGDCGEDEELGDFADGDTGGTRTFTQPEVGQTFAYYCSYHMPSMTGTVDVAEGGGGTPGSGVDITEYRINTGGATGEWVPSENTGPADPFVTTFTVSDEGDHVVEFRSTDVAGNVEEIGMVDFSIDSGGGGEPAVGLTVKPRTKRAKVNRPTSLTARLANAGGPATEVQVCVKAKSRLVKVTGGRCWWLDELPGGAARTSKFTFKPKRAARGKRVPLQFKTTHAGGSTETTTATLKVARK